MVHLMQYVADEQRTTSVSYKGPVLWNVPKDAIYFGDVPYECVHYKFESFWHALMISDEMFPGPWKDKK